MPRDHRLDFGIFVAIHREELDLDGSRVGAACGTTQSAYSNWERCKALPKDEEAVRALARQLKVPEDRLVSIWERATRDVAKKGFAAVTRAYEVKSKGGAGTDELYPVKGSPKPP